MGVNDRAALSEAEALRSGYMEPVVLFAKARSLERLRAYALVGLGGVALALSDPDEAVARYERGCGRSVRRCTEIPAGSSSHRRKSG